MPALLCDDTSAVEILPFPRKTASSIWTMKDINFPIFQNLTGSVLMSEEMETFSKTKISLSVFINWSFFCHTFRHKGSKKRICYFSELCRIFNHFCHSYVNRLLFFEFCPFVFFIRPYHAMNLFLLKPHYRNLTVQYDHKRIDIGSLSCLSHEVFDKLRKTIYMTYTCT